MSSEAVARSMDVLAEGIWKDAEARVRRIRDQAANRGRHVVSEAEAHVEELERAARELGRVRGAAAETSFERAADEEIRGVFDGAFDRLAERFARRVRLALESLPDSPAYPAALAAWARRAAACMLGGAADVFACVRDREAVYDALLEAGAEDFHVRLDRACKSGFVVRDLDGRTLLDARPEALVETHASALRTLLEARVPEAPTTGPEARPSAGFAG